MGNADYEIQQPFWVVVRGVLTSVVWEQILATALAFIAIKIAAACCRKRVSASTSLYVAVFASFFLWPQILGLYLSLTDTKDFGPIGGPSHHFANLFARLWMEFFLLPVLLNQSAIFVAGAVPFMWLATRLAPGRRPWVVTGSAAVLLPLAWIADFFNEGPR